MPRRLGAADRRRESAEQQAIQARLEAYTQRRFSSAIREAMRSAAGAWERDGLLGVSAVIAEHREQVQARLEEAYRRGATASGERLMGLVQEKHGRHARILKELPDAWDDALNRFIRSYTASKVTQISATTEAQLRAIIMRGEESGLGVEEIARSIRQDYAPQFGQYRAHMIARTETHAAWGEGSQAAGEASGLDMRKEWVASVDGRERDEHSNADTQEVGLKEAFIVMGQELKYPGDPNGSAENVINCRCVSAHIVD